MFNAPVEPLTSPHHRGLAAFAGSSWRLPPSRLLDLYRAMYRIRLIEEEIAARYPQRQMRCPVHLCIGQEAIPVSVSAHLGNHDYVMSGHRSHGHYLAKGGDLKLMMAELYGKATGCAGGKGGSMHLIDRSVGFLGAMPIVGSAIPVAVGVAFGSMLQQRNRVTVVYFGEAATEEGVFHESVNFAVLKRLPIIFVCENNFYSVYSSLSVRRREGQRLSDLVRAYGIASEHLDGNDVLELYTYAGEAVDRARNGHGPTFLECTTYRWREHCGPHDDDHLGYRDAEEVRYWKDRCPIRRLETALFNDGILTEEDIHTFRAQVLSEIESAVEFAQRSPFPSFRQLFTDVFAESARERT